MTITTLRDSLHALAQSLQISTSFPAALLVIMNLYFILPVFFPIFLDSVTILSMAVSSALLISYILYAFNFPLIRFLEGYKLRNYGWNQWLTGINQRKFYREYAKLQSAESRKQLYSNELPFDPEEQKNVLQHPLSRKEEKYWRLWQQASYECDILRYTLEHSFPTNPNAVLATSLGNVIAAFEDYPRLRYGMDSIALWPRLLPVLRTSKYHEYVAQEKITFDFLLNILAVTLMLGLEFFCTLLYQNKIVSATVTLIVTCILLCLLYAGVVVAARQWGTTVRVAFDLHRQELFQRLKLKPVTSTKEEFERWQRVSNFLIYRQRKYSFSEFLYTGESVEQKQQ